MADPAPVPGGVAGQGVGVERRPRRASPRIGRPRRRPVLGLGRGGDVPSLQIPGAVATVFDWSDGGVLTSGPSGQYRWPVVRSNGPGPGGRNAAAGAPYWVGPPQFLLPADNDLSQVAVSADGRSVVVKAGADKAVVLHADHPKQPVGLQGQPGLWSVVISPGGRWAATGPWDGRGSASGTPTTAGCSTSCRGPRRLAG